MQTRPLGNFQLIEAPGLPPGAFAATIAAHSADGHRIDFKADTEYGDKNRLRLAELLAPVPLTWLALEHGVHVARLSELPEGCRLVTADACLLDVPGQAVAFTTADCVPVVVVGRRGGGGGGAAAGAGPGSGDGDGQLVALAIHAGWRSLAAGIIEKALGILLGEGPATINPATLTAWIGPAIDQPNYEIDEPVRQALLSRPALAADTEGLLIASRPGHWLADLPGMARQVLIAAGLSPENVTDCALSTYGEAWLHSARRDGDPSGRMATFVALAG